MTKLADVLGIPDDVELLPRLEALTSGNVVSLPRGTAKPNKSGYAQRSPGLVAAACKSAE